MENPLCSQYSACCNILKEQWPHANQLAVLENSVKKEAIKSVSRSKLPILINWVQITMQVFLVFFRKFSKKDGIGMDTFRRQSIA